MTIALTPSIEPRADPAALREARETYATAYPRLPHDSFEPTSKTPLLRLSMVTLATLRHAPITRPIIPSTRGMASEAAMRVACIDAAGDKTAWAVAEELQRDHFGTHSRGFTRGLHTYRHRPLKGLDLLRGIDALGLIEYHCYVPSPHDPRRFERVRLGDAVARLTSRQRAEAVAQ